MKSMSYLFLFIVFFMYVDINANAQPAEIEILKKVSPDKTEKDSSQQKKRVIVIDKGKIDQLNLQSFEGLKNLQSLDQLKGLESLGQLKNLHSYSDLQDAQLFGGWEAIAMGLGKDMSELRLMKSFKGESVETTKKFSVSPDNTALNFNLSGKVKSGVISVTLFKPNGNKYKSIEIDPTSDVSYTQGIDLKKDPKEWTGNWQIKIQAEKADGDYRLTILTR